MAHTPLLSALQRAVDKVADDEVEARPDGADPKVSTSRRTFLGGALATGAAVAWGLGRGFRRPLQRRRASW